MNRFGVITSLFLLLDGLEYGPHPSSLVLVRDRGPAATSVELLHVSSAWTLPGTLRTPGVLASGPVVLAVGPVALVVGLVPVRLAAVPRKALADPDCRSLDSGLEFGPVAHLGPVRLAAVPRKALADPGCHPVDSGLVLVPVRVPVRLLLFLGRLLLILVVILLILVLFLFVLLLLLLLLFELFKLLPGQLCVGASIHVAGVLFNRLTIVVQRSG